MQNQVTFVNVCPHDILIHSKTDKTVVVRTFLKSGIIARVATTTKVVDTIDGIEISQVQYGELTDLPDAKPNTFYIASLLVAVAAAKIGRFDVLSPRQDDAYRVGNQLVSVSGFVKQ